VDGVYLPHGGSVDFRGVPLVYDVLLVLYEQPLYGPQGYGGFLLL
jgi:hypothetical protein